MVAQLIAKHTGKSPDFIQSLIDGRAADVFRSSKYVELLDEIDIKQIESSMVVTRKYLDVNLPGLVDFYAKKHRLSEFPLSGYMVANWLVGYLNTPENSSDLLRTHARVSRDVMRDVLPDLIEMLGEVPQHSAQWQKAFATMVIPLLAK